MSPSSSCAKSEMPTLATSDASTHSWSLVYRKFDGKAAAGGRAGGSAVSGRNARRAGRRVCVWRTGERAEGDRGRRHAERGRADGRLKYDIDTRERRLCQQRAEPGRFFRARAGVLEHEKGSPPP